MLHIAAPAAAFDPPADRSGPLSARIEIADTVTDTGRPLPVAVVVEADLPARGTARLAVIDEWRAEPRGPVAFAASPGRPARLAFTVRPGARTHAAHYPVHAYVEAGGVVLHPVAVVEARPASPPRPAPDLPAGPAPVAGRPPDRAAAPPAAPERALGTIGGAGVACAVRVRPGPRGLLDAEVAFEPAGGRRVSFAGLRGRVLGSDLDDPGGELAFLGAAEEPAGNAFRMRHRFGSRAGPFEVVGELEAQARALRARLWIEGAPPPRPWLDVRLEDASAGPWSERVRRAYAGPGNVLEEPAAFELGFDGHRLSTSFAGFEFASGLALVQGVDLPPDALRVDPDARVATLRAPHGATFSFIPCADVWEGAKAWRDLNGLVPAAGVTRLAGRFVFDLWGGNYGWGEHYRKSAEALARAFRYGLTDAAVVWHDWQRWGYDYRLPDVWPPSTRQGALPEFRALADLCRAHGVLFAPHDNYIDFYPDADGFSYDRIAFAADGAPVRAWLNSWHANAQSYRWRPDRVRDPLERNLRLVRDGLAPTAYFIDVWSSIGPYDCWTRDGAFLPRLVARDAWRDAFAWIRDALGGGAPQISESGHDQLVGWLDGAQANHLRVGKASGDHAWAVWDVACRDAERVPWADAAHHDRFVLHGAGYEPRFAAGLDLAGHGIYSDDYMSVEVLTGHPPMVKDAFGREVVRRYWLLHGAMRALALKRLEGVEFAAGSIHRQRVRWEGGAVVEVNRGADDWRLDGAVLPPYGWRVRARDAAAAVERRDGRIVEWSRGPSAWYVNPRDGRLAEFGPVAASGACRLAPEGDALVVTPLPDSGAFDLALDWPRLPWPLPRPARAEFLDESGAVSSTLPLPASSPLVSLRVSPGPFSVRFAP